MAEALPPSIVPDLTVRHARKALAFYREAFGGETLSGLEGEGGRIVHARSWIGAGLVMLHEEESGQAPMNGASGTLGGSPVVLRIELVEPRAVDTTFMRALALGRRQ